MAHEVPARPEALVDPATPRDRIIDAQIHVWKAPTPERRWAPDAIAPQREVPLEVPEVSAAMDRAGVTGALLLGPTWEGSRNDYVLATAAADPARYGALCRFDVSNRAAVEELADWRNTPAMRGIRLSLNRGDVSGSLEAAGTSGFFRAAEEHGVPLSIYAPGRYDLYARLAQEFPGLKITVDHLGVENDDRPLREAIGPLRELAAYPGIAVKASAMPCFVRENHPFLSVTEAVYDLVEWFGPERVFWGSDLSRLPVPYEQLVDVFVNHTPDLSKAERSSVLGEGLAAWLEWPEPPVSGFFLTADDAGTAPQLESES